MIFNSIKRWQSVLIALLLPLFFSCNKKEIIQPQTTDGIAKYQYFEDTSMWEHIFEKTDAYVIPQEVAPKAIIIPHHDITNNRQNSFYKALSKQIQPSVIVIISPDHFELGKNIITLPKDTVFYAPDGDMQLDTQLISQIAQNDSLKDGISLQSDLWFQEHGIYVHTPFLKHYFPNTKFIPILSKMLTTDTEFEYFEKLGKLLADILPDDALVIASVDFSHYQIPLMTQFHDRVSQNTIQNMEDPRYAEIDSPETIQAILTYCRNKNAVNPILIDRSFTFDYIPQEFVESTSHQYWCFYDDSLDLLKEYDFYAKASQTNQRYNDKQGNRNQTILIGGSGKTGAGIRKTWTWDRYNTSQDPAEILLRNVAGKEARFLYGFDAIIFDPEPGSTYSRTLHNTNLTVETITDEDFEKKYQNISKSDSLSFKTSDYQENNNVTILEVVITSQSYKLDTKQIESVLNNYDVIVLRDNEGKIDAKAYMIDSEKNLKEFNLGIIHGEGHIKGSLLAIDFYPDGITTATFDYESDNGIIPSIHQFWEESY